jgi:AbrB family looped-hinge helix DNA binding protein
METTATAKGQIVIPAPLRRKYGIREGTRIRIVDEGDRIVLRPLTPEYVRKLRGVLKGGGALKALSEERRRERELEGR